MVRHADLEDGLAPRKLGDGSTGREGDPRLAHLALLDAHLVGGWVRARAGVRVRVRVRVRG